MTDSSPATPQAGNVGSSPLEGGGKLTLDSLTEDFLLERSTADGEPDWLRDRRLAAFKNYRDQRWPERKLDEYWRNTPFAQLVDVGLPLVSRGDDITIEAPNALVESLDDPAAATLLDGEVVAVNVPDHLAEQGVLVLPLRQAAHDHADMVRTHLGSLTTTSDGTGADEDRTISVNDAAWDDGVFVHVPAEVEVTTPIGVQVHVTQPGTHLPRVLVVLGRFAKATVYVEHSSPDFERAEGTRRTPVLVDEVVEAIVGDGAALDLVTLNEFGGGVTHLSLQKAQANRDATYRHLSVNTGASTLRLRPEVDLVGAGASTYPTGVYFADEGQHFDLQPYIRHIAPRATSDVLYKGALQGKSRTIFRGNVLVSKEAVGTDTNETNRTLILTDGARADSTPFLEIHCADITAGHGSATGQIDARHLFYLESRGIPRDEALRLIVRGFFSEVLERFDAPGVRDHAMAQIEHEIDIADLDRIGVSDAATVGEDPHAPIASRG